MLSTTPEKRTFGLDMTQTSACIPGAMCCNWPRARVNQREHLLSDMRVSISRP
jgi:hypothetical protein